MQRIEKKERTFVSDSIVFEWEKIKSYFEELKEREIASVESLKQWLRDRSELSAVLEEEFAWRYIRMNIDTTNEEFQKSFQHFVQNINPKIAPFEDALNRKLNDSLYLKELSKEPDYAIMLKNTQTQIELFREENIPILTQLEEDSQKFGAIAAKMSVELDGKEYTLQQAAKMLKSTDRGLREKVYRLIQDRRIIDRKALNELFDHLIELRQKVAQNANFDNYRDYMFKAMGRFDYTAEDCSEFHQSIAETVVPLADKMAKKTKTTIKS